EPRFVETLTWRGFRGAAPWQGPSTLRIHGKSAHADACLVRAGSDLDAPVRHRTIRSRTESDLARDHVRRCSAFSSSGYEPHSRDSPRWHNTPGDWQQRRLVSSQRGAGERREAVRVDARQGFPLDDAVEPAA